MVKNREFIIVFQPKDRELYGKRRFAVGAESLHKYIGIVNAHNAFVRAIRDLANADKCRVKLRKCGIVDFYNK